MIVSNEAGKDVEVVKGSFVFSEDHEKANFIQWDELEVKLQVEIEELTREISDKADKLRQLILNLPQGTVS